MSMSLRSSDWVGDRVMSALCGCARVYLLSRAGAQTAPCSEWDEHCQGGRGLGMSAGLSSDLGC